MTCDHDTWKAWSDANSGRVVIKSKQSAGVLTELYFTSESSRLISADEPHFWRIVFLNLEEDTAEASPSFATLEEADAFFESIYKNP